MRQSSYGKDVLLHQGNSAFFREKDASSSLAWRTYMKDTPARREFKRHFGQANHYLVTTLVALHHLDQSAVVTAPPELRTSWNPRDKLASVQRSRHLVLQSFIGSAVDSIDMYVSLLYRWPNYIQDETLSSALDGTNRSVLRKAIAVAEHYEVDPITLALVDVLITWRNNLFHELAENDLRPGTAAALLHGQKTIADKYRGLDASNLAAKATRSRVLTFKETASLINAAHHFVQEVDAAVLVRLDIAALCSRIVRKAMGSTGDAGDFKGKYFCLPIEKRERFLRNWLMNSYGIVEPPSSAIEPLVRIKSPRSKDW